MLNLSSARKIIESGEPFNLSFWKKNGEMVQANGVKCTSSNFENNSFNVIFPESGEIRKIKALLIYNINGEEIFL